MASAARGPYRSAMNDDPTLPPSTTGPCCSRRRFVTLLPGLAAALVLGAAPLRAAVRTRRPTEHPDPRPGIDGSEVLTAGALAGFPQLIPLYDGIRKHAALADGVMCYCGCALLPDYRSLLTCYEGGAMAKFCPICQGMGRLLVGRAEEGQSLEQIRRAIDARFGNGGGSHDGHSLRAQGAHGIHASGPARR
jgi:hypothetical protein